jgi:hypothetical protein
LALTGVGVLGLGAVAWSLARSDAAWGVGQPAPQPIPFSHRSVWIGATMLAPLHDSLALGVPMVWGSVHRLPEHARFHHAAHVTKGMACETCHGAVWTMPRTVKVEPMSMGWCLDCHRDPEARLRPLAAVHERGWNGERRLDLLVRHRIRLERLTDCTTCHR